MNRLRAYAIQHPCFAKTAGSRLRSLAHVEQAAAKHWRGYVGGRPVFEALMDEAGVVKKTQMSKEFRGMGLGKKFYGEIARRSPGGRLFSDSQVSADARRVWDSFGRNPRLEVQQSVRSHEHMHPVGELGAGEENGGESVFGLRMPEKARLSAVKNDDPVSPVTRRALARADEYEAAQQPAYGKLRT